MLSELHFLRPGWLLLIPVAVILIVTLLRARIAAGNWQRYVAPALRDYVLARPNVLQSRRWPVVAALAAAIISALALAGPAWERLPVPAFRSDEALVVALDLSRSMDAADVAPSRLARAKIKLLEMLEQRTSGEVALVVFTTHAFTVTPLTADERTIASLVSSVYTSIMPSQGSYIPAGLEKAATLLRQAGVNGGEILLITDADADPDALASARSLARDGIRIHVLAVGTQEGAPIPDPDGGFLTDGRGQVVVPMLDVTALRSLASAGNGRFAQLTPDDTDLDILFPDTALATGFSTKESEEENQIDVWRDEGIWLSVLLLPLLAMSFRRGWVLVLVVLVAAPPQRAEAFEWADLWQRPDQRGAEALEREDPLTAAELFENSDWRAVAEYRAGEYAQSAATLNRQTANTSTYNRGNALARAGELEAAIAAYDEVIAADPEHADAIYNRELVAELLEQQQQQQEQEQQQSDGEQAQADSGEGEQDNQSSGSNQSEDGNPGEQGQSAPNESDANANPQAPSNQDSSDIASNEQPQTQDQEQRQQLADAGEPEDQATNTEQGAPQDIEEWASDQAAEQWLRRVPQDPGGLLRRKFLYQYQRMGVDQDGNFIWPTDESQPW